MPDQAHTAWYLRIFKIIHSKYTIYIYSYTYVDNHEHTSGYTLNWTADKIHPMLLYLSVQAAFILCLSCGLTLVSSYELSLLLCSFVYFTRAETSIVFHHCFLSD